MAAPADVQMAEVLSPTDMIGQGAEARVFVATFCGRPAIVKERITKSYRIPALEEKISINRLKQEARSLVRARKLGVDCPGLLFVDLKAKRLYMERVQSNVTVKDKLWSGCDEADALTIMGKVGQGIARLHDGDIVHGDLTTSNMMLRGAGNVDDSVAFIDFGLSYNSSFNEDKAVDLYVLERALLSTHPNSEVFMEEIVRSYCVTSKKSGKTMEKLEVVRQRGRKRVMLG